MESCLAWGSGPSPLLTSERIALFFIGLSHCVQVIYWGLELRAPLSIYRVLLVADMVNQAHHNRTQAWHSRKAPLPSLSFYSVARLSLLDRLPLHAHRPQRRQARHDQRHPECCYKSIVVNLESSLEVSWICDQTSQASGTCRYDSLHVHPWNSGEAAEEAIGEHILTYRNYQCST